MSRRTLRDLVRACDGIAMTELALTLPVFLLLLLAGAELANYMTVRMRVSQLALHLADNGARIGTGTQLQDKRITELDINDMLIGANLQASSLDLATQGRVIVSSLEHDPANAGRFRIRWQRCFGSEHHTRLYGTQGQTNLTGMGPPGQRITVMPDTATIFVELNYRYRPLIPNGSMSLGRFNALQAFGEFTEIAAMTVRDRRDLTQVYPSTGVTASTC